METAQLEKIIASHTLAKGIVPAAEVILKSQGYRVDRKTIKSYWEENKLPTYSFTEFIHLKINEYALEFNNNPDKISSKINQELRPYHYSITHETILKYMTKEGLYTPQKHGGVRHPRGNHFHTPKKISKEKKELYFFTAP